MNKLSQDFRLYSLIKFALPTIVMMLFMGLYTIGDTVFVSRFVNTDALSALNIVCPVINIIVGLGTMLATGGNAVVACKMGERNELRAAKDFTLIVCAGILFGFFTALLGILFIDDIIWGLGASQVLFPYCRQYLFILLLFTPASMLQVLFQSLIVTAGRPGLGMTLSIGAGAFNVMLDYIFMVPLKMGVAGSALGTGIGYLIPSIIGIAFFARNKNGLRFHKPQFDFPVLVKSCSNGFSEMVSQIAAAVTTFLFNLIMMQLLGENGVAAITIIIYSQFLMTALYIGFSMGVAPVISYNYGRKDSRRLKKLFQICYLFIGTVSILVFLAAMLLGPSLVNIFSPKGTPVYGIAKQGFRIFPYSFLFCGINIFTSAAFTALSDGKHSAIISALRTFIFITAALLILPQALGVTGVWLAIPLAEFVTVFFSAAFMSPIRLRHLAGREV